MGHDNTKERIEAMPTPLPKFSGARLDAIIKQRGWTVERFAQFVRMVSPEHSKFAAPSAHAYIKGENEPGANFLPVLGLVLGLKNPIKELFEEPRIN